MLRFDGRRQSAGPRNYLARREQRRLLVMVAALGFVALLALRVDSPGGHAVLAAAFGMAEEAPNATNAAEKAGTLQDAQLWLNEEQQATIRDNTIFRTAESPAWFEVFSKLRLRAPNPAQSAPVVYAQLAQQPNAYRGRSVSLAGDVMLVERQTPAENEFGIQAYWRVIFRPQGRQVWPIAVYSLEKPQGVEPGKSVVVPGSATGVFFKNLTYQSESGAGLMPVVLAREVTLDPVAKPSSEPSSGGFSNGDLWKLVAVASAIAGVIVALIVLFNRPKQRRTPPPAAPGASLGTSALKLILIALLFLTGRPVSAESPFDKVLDSSGWPEDRIKQLESQQPIPASDMRELFKLAKSLSRFEDRLRSDAVGLRQGDIGLLSPVVGAVSVVSISDEFGDWPASLSSDYYRCVVTAGEQEIEVLSRQLPGPWLREELSRSPLAEVLALRLPAGRLLAVRWRWFPTRADYPVVNFGESVLGGLGIDVAELDRVADGVAIRANESDAFYSVLSAMKQVGAHQLVRFADRNRETFGRQWVIEDQPSKSKMALAANVQKQLEEGRYPVAPLFNDAVNQRGELYVLDGLVRRAVAVETSTKRDEAPNAATRWGVDTYYELEVFAPDSQNLPVVFCVLDLPEGFPLGDDLSEPVRVAGFSFKRWAYGSRMKTDDKRDKKKLAPLLIGRAPLRLQPAPASGIPWGAIGGGAFVLALGAVCWTVWRTARSDARHEAASRQRLSESPDEFDPDRLANLATPPDGGATSGQG